MKQVSKAQVRLEGEVNQNWTITYIDGSVEEFEAIEESPSYSYPHPLADQKVHQHDKQLADFLQDMVDLGSSLPGWNQDEDAIDFDVDMVTRTIYNIEFQKPDSNGDYQEINSPDTYKF